MTTEIDIKGYKVVVDTEDVPLVSEYTWRTLIPKQEPWLVYFRSYTRGSHATRQEVFLHRLIMQCHKGDGKQIDHRDGNTLNNSKANLRFCTVAQNVMNARKSAIPKSSPYKGVTYSKKMKKWKVTIQANGVPTHLGYYDDIELARSAYVVAAKQYFGEFAREDS